MSIRITSSIAGFRRAGVAHPAVPTLYPNDHFTPEQIRQLEAEPRLVVEHIEDPAQAGGDPDPQGTVGTAGVSESMTGHIDGVVNADGTQQDLAELKVDELRDLAKELEISGYSDMKKAELVTAIKAEQVEVAAEPSATTESEA